MKKTISKLLTQSYKKLCDSNIESYILDSQIILSYLLDKDRIYLHTHKFEEVNEDIERRFNELIEKRSTGYPIKYITKSCEFMGMTFYIEEGVLIPRSDTEILVEAALDKIDKGRILKIADVCCGSGVIGISIAKLTLGLKCHMFDISDKALEVSRVNTKKLNVNERVEIIKSNLLNYSIENNIKYDLIVSNPPYIEKEEIKNLMRDVKDFEPKEALDGGSDGLEFYRKISYESQKCFNIGGFLCFEIGYNQRKDVCYILKENNFINIECYKDLSNNDRVVLGQFAP